MSRHDKWRPMIRNKYGEEIDEQGNLLPPVFPDPIPIEIFEEFAARMKLRGHVPIEIRTFTPKDKK